MDFVLDEKVDQWDQCSKEPSRKILSVLDRLGVRWAEVDASGRPWDRKYQVRDHQDVMPIVVVGRRDVGPPSAGERSNKTREGDPFGKRVAGFGGQEIKEADKGEPRTWAERSAC